VPFLIAWGETEHPSLSAAHGARLESFTIAHPDPAAVREQLAAVGVTGIPVEPAPSPALRAQIRTPSGAVDLG
jgi:hypothetical protein